MAQHTATVRWECDNTEFVAGRYSRAHTWNFDGGATIPASSSPHVVPVPYSNPANVDPEEAFVASIASCHMLWFLSIAAKRGFAIEYYEDAAVGLMAKDAYGCEWVSSVTLRPLVIYAGERPSPEEESGMHHAAHEACFIANSVRSVITVQPVSHPGAVP